MSKNQQSTSLMRFGSKVTFEPVTEDVTGKKKARKRFSKWREKKKRIKVFSAGLSAPVLLQASSSLVFPGSGTNQTPLVLRVFPSSRLVSSRQPFTATRGSMEVMRTRRTRRCLQSLPYRSSRLNAAGADLSGTEHTVCALDFGFYVRKKTLEGKREGWGGGWWRKGL